MRTKETKKRRSLILLVSLFSALCVPSLAASTQTQALAGDGPDAGAAAKDAPKSEETMLRDQIASIYQGFYRSYRLGAGDAIAIHIDKHPDDSVERVVVSPGGQVYFALMGNVQVAGRTVPELQDFFATSISEYIRDPKVTLTLLEANSAKIGVLGDVRTPGVIILSHPMRVLDAITTAGGITDTGSKEVSVLRQFADGRVQTMKVNLKQVLAGKAGPEENFYLSAGDTIIVHGNFIKKMQTVSSVMGIATFFAFLSTGK